MCLSSSIGSYLFFLWKATRAITTTSIVCEQGPPRFFSQDVCHVWCCFYLLVFFFLIFQVKFPLPPLFHVPPPSRPHPLVLHHFSSNTHRPPRDTGSEGTGKCSEWYKAPPLLLRLVDAGWWVWKLRGMGSASRQHNQRQLLLPLLGVSCRKIKLHNCNMYAECLGQCPAGSPIVSSVSVIP